LGSFALFHELRAKLRFKLIMMHNYGSNMECYKSTQSLLSSIEPMSPFVGARKSIVVVMQY
jgi:hypothetical protein